MNHIKEKVMEGVFLFTAVISIIAVALICVFLFANGFPAMQKIGVWQFLSGKVWKPTNNIFGIFPMILGSIYVTGGALLIGVPVGILMSIFMARFCPEKLYRILKPIVDLLAGIPSIVYGFFGLVVLVPFIREHFKGNGNSILTASILLGIMILPTIIGVSESAIRAVENSYYEGALALGATHERSVFTVIVPAAKSGIMAAVVLGVGRAIGETMAVMMVAGNQARVPSSIFKGVRTLTANIVMEMGYATDLHREALIATGVVLVSLLITTFTGVNIDGLAGAVVAVFVFMAGIEAAKETVYPLLGQPPEESFVRQLKELVMEDEHIIGIHDLIVHNYGPGRVFVTLHAEVPYTMNLLAAHDIIDIAEHRVAGQLHCGISIHMDPVVNDDKEVEELKEMVLEVIAEIDDRLSIHDFRSTKGPYLTNLIFDLVVPHQYKYTDKEVQDMVHNAIQKKNPKCFAVVTVERSYIK